MPHAAAAVKEGQRANQVRSCHLQRRKCAVCEEELHVWVVVRRPAGRLLLVHPTSSRHTASGSRSSRSSRSGRSGRKEAEAAEAAARSTARAATTTTTTTPVEPPVRGITTCAWVDDIMKSRRPADHDDVDKSASRGDSSSPLPVLLDARTHQATDGLAVQREPLVAVVGAHGMQHLCASQRASKRMCCQVNGPTSATTIISAKYT
jgi:hypothetical protein